MREQLISEDTAKLAKEKGFTIVQRVITVYDEDTPNESQLDEHGITQSLLQKWIREVHKINVECNYMPNTRKYRCLYIPMNIKPFKYKSRSEVKLILEQYLGKEDFNTYEEALEQGLQEALKQIQNK